MGHTGHGGTKVRIDKVMTKSKKDRKNNYRSGVMSAVRDFMGRRATKAQRVPNERWIVSNE